jgi:polysaccharide pyruvyl transferase WcaK-like protein
MKLLYVSDNRTGSNWGCRATSIALEQILATKFFVADTIYNDMKKKSIPVGSIFPVSIRDKINSNSSGLLERGLRRFDYLFMKSDYVSFSPTESVSNLIRYKSESPELDKIYNQVSNSDVVVINGEGDMIFNPARRTLKFLLMIIELADQLSIPVFFVNAMISICPSIGLDRQMAEMCFLSLKKCSGIALRDPLSLKILEDFSPDFNAVYIPDALFSWTSYCSKERLMTIPYGDAILPYTQEKFFGKFDFSKPYICLGGSSLAVQKLELAVKSYSNLATKLANLGMQIYLVDAGEGLLMKQVAEATGLPVIPLETPILLGATVLANAQVFISGRYHPSIMASLGGTPCIFMGSNSHKTFSLQDVLGYESIVEYSAIPTSNEVDEIVEKTREALFSGSDLRDKISCRVKVLSQKSESLNEFILNSLL